MNDRKDFFKELLRLHYLARDSMDYVTRDTSIPPRTQQVNPISHHISMGGYLELDKFSHLLKSRKDAIHEKDYKQATQIIRQLKNTFKDTTPKLPPETPDKQLKKIDSLFQILGSFELLSQ